MGRKPKFNGLAARPNLTSKPLFAQPIIAGDVFGFSRGFLKARPVDLDDERFAKQAKSATRFPVAAWRDLRA
jgi:hypothetical protein